MAQRNRFLTEISGPRITEAPSPNWIFERIEEWAARFPRRFAFAVDHQDRVEEYGYADVLQHAEGIAAGLEAHRIQPGDRVGILMENIPQWVFVLLGAMRHGAVTVPLATMLPEAALRRIGEHAGCTVLFADGPNLEKALHVAAALQCRVVAFNSSAAGAIPWEEFENRRPNSESRNLHADPDATVLLIYTSGTTGEPKGVQLTMNNLIYEIRGVVEPFEISPDHRILSVLPFSHVLPLIANGIGPLCVGAGVVFLSSISPQRITEAFHRHRITLFVCVPQFFYLLHRRIFAQVASRGLPLRMLFRAMLAISRRVRSQRFRRKLFAKIHKTIGADLHMLASGGSRFDERVARDLDDLGYTVLQAYGLTETSAAATATPKRANRIGAVGLPIRGAALRIDSPNDEGIGEVWIRGPILMKGYYRDDIKTAEIIQDGWLRTGDLGFLHPDGNLAITGRIKDVIVLASGKNIYPEEVELHYSQSPFIKEICVLGVSGDGDRPETERLHALVVPDMDEFRRVGQMGIQEVVRFEIENLSKQLPSYQRVLSFDIRNEAFPRTVTRKLKRFEIQEQEKERKRQTPEHAEGPDHPRLREGSGSVIADLVRQTKPDAGPLDPSVNLELDLGFDSLVRVELLANAESRLGVHIDEEQAARIFTVGELVDAFENALPAEETTAGRNWKEILDIRADDPLNRHHILRKKTLSRPFAYLSVWMMRFIGRVFFRLRWSGLEKLPKSPPFIICPNHESFLDGPFVCAVLPLRILSNIFILGYSEHWDNRLSRRLAELCNIVSIDPSVHLIRAMQAGAVGLRHNKILMVFPEGTRSIDGQVAEFKKGAAVLACELGVPVVPVGIRGTFEAWPRAGVLRLHPVELRFGNPIDPKEFQGAPDPYIALTERLRKEVQILSGDKVSKELTEAGR